CHQENSFPLTF
nr:immunoglobulin light chain junction region [Macaca mulatta]